MVLNNELSIVVPCKNEENFIGRLLDSLEKQSYPMSCVKVIIADAESTDGTGKVIDSFVRRGNLEIRVVKGGLPAKGRNNGAKYSRSKYILFIDADIILEDRKVIESALNAMKSKNLKCTTTNILCYNGGLIDNAIYLVNDFVQYASKYISPFSSGMFMLFERKKFEQLGGFDERVNYAEDYFLTKNLMPSEFSVTWGYIKTPNRRFKKMGRLRTAWMFIVTMINSNNEKYFMRAKDYW